MALTFAGWPWQELLVQAEALNLSMVQVMLILMGLVVTMMYLSRRQPTKASAKAPASAGANASRRLQAPGSQMATTTLTLPEEDVPGCEFSHFPRASGAEGKRILNAPWPYAHAQFVISPGTPQAGLCLPNTPEVCCFENAHTYGKYLPLFRPTADPQIDSKGAWTYATHFKGRKRLWENRLQFRLKKELDGPLLFGIQLDQYVPLGAASKRLSSLVVAALRRVVGSDLYHSPGEDPEVHGPDAEKPTFVMPLWAFDQFIETPEGEEPPNLNDPNFSKLGTLRTSSRKDFIAQLKKLNMRPGPTYSFAFWGIAQYMDAVKWEVSGVLPMRVNFNKFCGSPPVHCVLYTIKNAEGSNNEEGSQSTKETRHLENRKNYLFHIAFWSTLNPPSQETVAAMFPYFSLPTPDAGNTKKLANKGNAMRFLGQFFTCCSVRPP